MHAVVVPQLLEHKTRQAWYHMLQAPPLRWTTGSRSKEGTAAPNDLILQEEDRQPTSGISHQRENVLHMLTLAYREFV